MRSVASRISRPGKSSSSNSTDPQSQKVDVSSGTKFPKRTGAANTGSTSKPGLNQPKPAKRTRNRIPPPQRERILQEYAAGKSIAAISKQEKRNRETVGKIVRGPEMAEFVRMQRERFFALGPDAISAIHNALTKEKDARLGFQILASIGVIPSPAELQSLMAPPPSDEEAEVKKIAVQMVEGAIERNRFFGLEFPEADEAQRQLREKQTAQGKNQPRPKTS